MDINQTIEDAVAARDTKSLDVLMETLFRQADAAEAPFSPALALKNETDLPEAEAVAQGGRSVVVGLANRISRARRRIAWELRIAGGFQGLRIVSEGDSWFQYPLLLEDIIDNLSEDDDKAILSLGAGGDTLQNIARDLEFLDDLTSSDADVLLLSAGGNDLLGRGKLASVLRPYAPGMSVPDVLDPDELDRVFNSVERDYREILQSVAAARPGISVLAHGYDLPVPTPNGHWLGSAFEALGIPLALGREVLESILERFNVLLGSLAREYAFFKHLDVRGQVGNSRNSWFDELHPRNSGFARVAEVFREALEGMGAAVRPENAGNASASRSEARTMSAPEPTAFVSAAEAEPQAAATDTAVAYSSFAERRRMAEAILGFEARRENGELAVYYLPPGDGGGRYEVAGINERWHKAEADHLVALIEAGRHDAAEAFALEFIAGFTDEVDRWCTSSAIESYLRDSYFNRGKGGAAWVVQKAVGVTTDRIVGPITRQAIRTAEADPEALLIRLRETRETYERQIVDRNEQSIFWNGLVNRWNKALDVARSFLNAAPQAVAFAEPRSIVDPASVVPQLHQQTVFGAPVTHARMREEMADHLAIKGVLKSKTGLGQGPRVVRDPSAGTSLAATPVSDPKINVVGIGVGEQITLGAPTGLMAVKVYVRRKFASSQMPRAHAIAPEFDGIPVDIVEVGDIVAQRTPDPTARFATPPPGCSVGSSQDTGTFGATVRDASGRQLILSNNHVLAHADGLPVGAPIYQEGPNDLPAGQALRQIARLHAAPTLGDDDLDIALAEPLPGVTLSRRILHIGAPQGTTSGWTNMEVHKFGRTSRYTVGSVDDMDADVYVSYRNGMRIFFRDQIQISGRNGNRFSEGGDSGSLILERRTNAAVALLFAGTTNYSTNQFMTFAHPIEDVLSALDVTLV